MIESVEWLGQLIVNYPALQYLLVFLGTAIGGDVLLVAFAFLSAQGIVPPVTLFLFGFLGTFSSDLALFLLARTKFLHNIISHRYTNKTTSTIVEALRRISRGSHFWALVIAKFLLATRLVILLYSNKTDLKFKKFFYYDALAVIIWLAIVVPIGFLLGLGFTYLSEVFKNIYAGVGLVLLFILIAFMVEMWLKKTFTSVPNDNQ